MSPVPAVRTLLLVWLSLIVLLALTTASSYLHLGIANSLINMIVAAIKFALIALFFMHLRRADAAVRIAAGAALLFLFFLAFLSFSDLLTRSNQPAAWREPVYGGGQDSWNTGGAGK